MLKIMLRSRRGRVAGLLCALLGAGVFPPASAQEYPSKAVTLIVPFPAGSPPEVEARFLAQFLSERSWKKPVVVEGRPGAGGVIAADYVVKSAPDGHTLLFVTAGITTFKIFTLNMTFDPAKDLAPVSLVTNAYGGLMINTMVPAKNLDEFVAYVKANSGKLNYGSAGRNTTMLIAEAFLRANGIRMTEIPYAGQIQYVTALMRNDVQMVNAGFNSTVKGQIDGGAPLRPILVAGERRSPLFPDVPTAAEKGWAIPGNSWNGMLAPASTPARVVDALAVEVSRYAAAPDMQKVAQGRGTELVSSTPAEFKRKLEADTRAWTEVANSVGIKPE